VKTAPAVAAVLAVWQAEPVHEAVEHVARGLGRPITLVGGAVRDALLGHRVEDWDLAVSGAREVAAQLAERTGGRLVALHEWTPCFRVVLDRRNPDYCLDVSELRGELTADLASRDVTINALGFDVVTHELCDPVGGLADLARETLRAVSLANLQADALRCLRVYRLHSELGFAIEPQTREWLRQVAPLAPAMPGERLGEEMLKALNPPRAAQTIRLMDEDGLLGHLIPEIEPARGVRQGGYHHLDVWGHTVEVVAQLEAVLQEPARHFPLTHHEVERYLARKHTAASLLFTALLHDLGKPATRTEDERGWCHFYDHDRLGAEMARKIARRFRMRRRHVDLASLLVGAHLRPLQLANLQAPQDGREPQPITRHALVRLLRSVQPHGVGLFLLALADVRACRGPATTPGFPEQLAGVLDEMLQRYLDWQRERQAPPLLTGRDLIAAGFAPGERFGQVLAAVEEAQIEDMVSTRDEALALARRLMEDDASSEAKAEMHQPSAGPAARAVEDAADDAV